MKNKTGKMHRSWIWIGLLCPAMEFSLFLESNGKPLSGFKAEKEHNETRLVEITASVLENFQLEVI